MLLGVMRAVNSNLNGYAGSTNSLGVFRKHFWERRNALDPFESCIKLKY